MLVLSRKEGEKIHIGNDIVVTVTSLKGGRVKLGIEAPHNVTVLRGELKSDDHATWDSANADSFVGHLIGHP